MKEVKCECGHSNPQGTIICESCGKPLEDQNQSKNLLNMRYEGVARRSQTYKSTIIDKIWMFFSSVKVGIWIIVLILVASIFGTIFPQEFYIGGANPATFYKEEYGALGEIYYQLGFHDLYGSWWYMLLLASLGISLIIASLDRVVPLHRALKNQRTKRHENFMKRQRVFSSSTVEDEEEVLKHVKEKLKAKRYQIREEEGHLVAEKGRFSRWGPYVNHLGLIIFLIGCMLRYFPGFYLDEHVWVREGEVQVVPGSNQELFLENEQFLLEIYDQEEEADEAPMQAPRVKNYQTNAVLYQANPDSPVGVVDDLQEVERHDIRVNDPLEYQGYKFYQLDYKLNELATMSFTVENKESSEQFGRMDVDLNNPQDFYELDEGYMVKVEEYFPDFYMDDNNEPASRTRLPNNPVFVFNITTPETPDGETSLVGIAQNIEPFGENDYKVTFVDVTTNNVTGIGVRKDITIPILIAGGAIFMIGLVQGSYWAHRRIWFQKIKGEIWIAGHTNKNWLALRKDIDEVIDQTDLSSPIDQVEMNEKNNELKNQNQEG
ncbi:cytochrome c biogenesis protein ResB [Alkalihalobacillus trypoxylicola]|uniref:Cytochrome C biogenesis protein n=1 Tax=Alkalihalobacillus trypoxylicola TaxID=519424 RepID=A0A162EL29_9BACI|nr:cytochrome c biogenesis protein ResB [Alkalihalobacillus trypoxylicola]KYG33158.1 cytochrome C biogenesis protein [Alkalihalobacillus trypoxylicola]